MVPPALKRAGRRDAVRWTIAAAALVLVSLLGSGYWAPEPYWRAVNALDDWRQGLIATEEPSAPVAIVDIDEQSLNTIGPWPWPRALQARLLGALFEQEQARAVGLDIVFPEPEPVGAGDDALLAVAGRHPLVFAQVFDFSATGRASRSGALSGATTLAADDPWERLAPVASGYIGNFFPAQQQPCTGHVTPSPDPDGAVRAIAPFIRYEGALYPMLALQMIRCANLHTDDGSRLGALATTLPQAHEAGFAAIPFHRARAAFESFSALDILSGKVPPGRLAGRYVLVGSSAMGLSDRIATPIDPWLPGVVAHAELLDWLLAEHAGPTHRTSLGWLPLLWAGLSIPLFAWMFRSHKAAHALAVLAAGTAAWCATAVALPMAGYPMRVDLPLVVAGVFLFAQAPFEWISAQAQARAFGQRFGRYLPPEVMRQILERADEAAFEPRRHLISVLFVDIAGYTTMAESLEPEELLALTDRILTRLTEHVHAFGGTLDKYIGDAVMAFWGAPLTVPDHADRALSCARAMLDGMARLNVELNGAFPGRRGEPPIRIRVSVNSGEAVVGEIGSTVRRSYTALGDSVNIAARLLDYAREAGQPLLVGQRTARLCQQHALDLFAETALRGRLHREQVYVLSPASPLNDTITAAPARKAA
ncbi:adenylate/guanylate cyclase domain-containing protein [Cupriavidus necator]|uniref:Adenylate/guanylate cyclase domain-containing protein n=1 Tax=Cupriavidus necator TaxID=106590 RepID=A0A1U9UVB9_CUPNE|nr:adenylate/guanylate cyclase domain-containing protein [Cupriavidus necator]AQV96377.1 adenylate/guanylate cyclase domain-containing protein [Cupriavidus necator]